MCKVIDEEYPLDIGGLLEVAPEYWRKRYLKLKECGSYLDFAYDIDDVTYNKLVNANFCKYRLCPACSWRKSLKTYSSTRRICDFIKDKEKMKKYGLSVSNYEYIFGTFTIKNVPVEKLSDAIDTLIFGFTHRFMRRKDIKKGISGCIRTLEVTFNSKTKEFHPHIHAIFLVDSDYFKANYISFEKFQKFAKSAFKCDYNPSTKIMKIKNDNLDHAISEVSKYSVKEDDFISDQDDVEYYDKIYSLRVLDRILEGRRLLSYSGIFKKVRNILRDDSIISEDDDLIEIDGQKIDENRNLKVISSRYDIYKLDYVMTYEMDYIEWKELRELQIKNEKIMRLSQSIKSESRKMCGLDSIKELLFKMYKLDKTRAKVYSDIVLGWNIFAWDESDEEQVGSVPDGG